MKNREARTLIGCCGLNCGLCNKYQSKAPSRCLGCKLGEQHSWCSIWNCCVKKHKFETCAECPEISRCPILLRRKVAEWIPAADNLREIRETGLERWLTEQQERQVLLEELLRDYNEGRSMTLFCKACARMPIQLIHEAIDGAKARLAAGKVAESDTKSKAKVLKSVINDVALESSIDLN